MTRGDFNVNSKTLNKIQKHMHDNKSKFRDMYNMMARQSNTTFVFPDGEVIRVDSHSESAHIIHKNLRLKQIKSLIDLQRCGIIRAGFMADIFYAHSIAPPTKKAEESISDMIVSSGTNSVMIHLHPDYKKQETALEKRLCRKLDVEIV